jgi:hypothetical protein
VSSCSSDTHVTAFAVFHVSAIAQALQMPAWTSSCRLSLL